MYGVVRIGFFEKGIFMQSSTETEEETVNECGEVLANQVIKYTESEVSAFKVKQGG